MHEVTHADLIRAVLDGKVVQTIDHTGKVVMTLRGNDAISLMASAPHIVFRLKPEPTVHWLPVWKDHPDASAVCIGESYGHRIGAERADLTGRRPTHVLHLALDEDLNVVAHRTEPA